MKGVVVALLVALLLIPTSVSAAFIQNVGMESVSQKDTSYCAKFLITGCQEGNMNVWKPNVWNTFFGSHDLGQSWTDSHSGSWSVAVWYQPPAECGWNSTSGTCGETTEGYDGSLVQHDISLSSSPATVSFWAKKCPFRPIQCNSWNCDGTQYYGTNETNIGQFMFQMTDVNSTASIGSYPFSATDNWKKYSVSLSANTSHMFDVYWQTVALSGTQAEPNCILFDDFEITYGTGQTSPALVYINDMVNKSNFPYNYGGAGVVGTLEISKHFQNVPMVYYSWQASSYSGCLLGAFYTGNCNPTIKIGYVNGNTLDVSSFSVAQHTCVGANLCQNSAVLPLLNYTNVKNVTISSSVGGTFYFNLTSNLTVRSTYGNLLDGYEDIHANPNLFPVIIYNLALTPSGNLTFNAWNFKSSESVTSNLIFNLLGSGGSVIDTTSGTYTFPSGMSGWGQTAFAGEFTGAEAVNITFKSSSAILGTGTYTFFPLTGAVVSCTSGCDETIITTYVEREYSGGACVSNYLVNDSRCAIPPVPVPPANVLYNTSTIEPVPFINQTAVIAAGWGWVLPLSTPFFILTMFMLVVVGVLAFLTKSAEVAVGSLLLLMMAFTFLGIYPIWIGIIFTIIAGLILAKMMGIIGGG